MRISPIISLCLLTILSVSQVTGDTHRGYIKDDQGRTLIYRSRPSLWLLPGGALVGALGGFIAHDAWHGNPRAFAYFSSNINKLHKDLPSIRIGLPVKFSGTIARAIGCTAGGALAVSGLALWHKWFHNYRRLNEPLIIIDRHGIWYDGKGTYAWKDIKSVRLVRDTIANQDGHINREYALEVVTTYGRLLIDDGDVAITVEALYDLIRQYRYF